MFNPTPPPMPEPIYLDHHATTPCDPRVIDAMLPTFGEAFGNASSRQHAHGKRAAELVEGARGKVASLIAADPREIVFTSGATESDNLAIKGVARWFASQGHGPRNMSGPGHVVTSAIEHKAVLDSCAQLEKEGLQVTYLPPNRDGLVDATAVEAALRPETVLVTLMLANNEIGTINPVSEVGKLCKERGVTFHCDAVQGMSLLDCSVDALGVDLLSLSAHKIYGPKGVGALYVRRRAPHVRLQPLFDGGRHERGVRSGTLNVPGIVGMGVACEIVENERESDARRIKPLRDSLLAQLREALPDLHVNGSLEHRLPNNLNVSFPGLDGEALVGELRGLSVSSGAACSSATHDSSYVVKSLYENNETVGGSLRFGLGRSNSTDEVVRAAKEVVNAARRLRETPPKTSIQGCDSISECVPGATSASAHRK